MKKHIWSILSLFAVTILLLLASCRDNDGEIGRIYGIWNLTAMEVDGEPYDGWRRHGFNSSFFQFQNNICFIQRVNELYDSEYRACTWKWVKGESVIELNFTHTDSNFPNPEPDGTLYGAPGWLLLGEPIVYTFNVRWNDDSYTVWTTTNTDGQLLTYHLEKTF